MIDYDLHVHTEYCGHAEGMTVETIVRQAEELGLSAIAITDHIFQHDNHAIIRRIREDVAACAPSLKVYVGAEVDVDPDHTDGRFVTDTFEGLDYVVAGFHYVPTVGNYPRCLEDNVLHDEEFLSHWRTSLLGIVSNPVVHTLAHPGRLLAASVDLDVHFEDALNVFAEAAELSMKNKIAWELNEMTGHRLSPQWLDQWHRIYEIALEAGVKIVYGSDAHMPEAIGTHDYTDMILDKLPADCLAGPEEIIQL
jgi:HisJ family histidinol phosphate phosphatase